MDFDFSSEQTQLRDMLRRYLGEHASSAKVRAVLDGPETHDRQLWQGLAELGILGIAIPEAYAGAGLGYLELCVAAEELGRVVAPVPFSSSAYLATELLLAAGSEEQKAAWLPRLASGKAIGTLALAELPGVVTPQRLRAQWRAGRLDGVKRPVPDGDIADFAVVAVRDGDDVSLVLAGLVQDGVTRGSVDTIDPLRSHARLEFRDAVAESLGERGRGWALLETAMDRAATLIAFEQIGGSDRVIAMARDHALDRVAFGRAIGSFQAIKHMLADMYVEATLARSNAYYAAWALSTGDADLPLAAARARVSATLAYRHCARNAIQVHGGMGFTWGHDCHLHFRRANQLALALGGLPEWEAKLVARLREQYLAGRIVA